MSRSTLLALPYELRLMIYKEAICPTGYVLLRRKDASDHNSSHEFVHHQPTSRRPTWPRVDARLLLSCRAIYDDARGLFFKMNRVRVSDVSLVRQICRKSPWSLSRIQHLHLDLDMRHSADTSYALISLYGTLNYETLKSLTMRVRAGFITTWEHSSVIYDNRDMLGLYQMWRGSTVSKVAPAVKCIGVALKYRRLPKWVALKKRVEVYVEDQFDPQECYFSPNGMLREINKGFGGELWVGKDANILCFKDGEMVQAPFEWGATF